VSADVRSFFAIRSIPASEVRSCAGFGKFRLFKIQTWGKLFGPLASKRREILSKLLQWSSCVGNYG